MISIPFNINTLNFSNCSLNFANGLAWTILSKKASKILQRREPLGRTKLFDPKRLTAKAILYSRNDNLYRIAGAIEFSHK